MYDTFWITLPITTWQRLFERATQADRTASDFLRTLIEDDGHLTKTTNGATVFNPSPEGSLNHFRKPKRRRENI